MKIPETKEPTGGLAKQSDNPVIIAMQNWFELTQRNLAYTTAKIPDKWTFDELCKVVEKSMEKGDK